MALDWLPTFPDVPRARAALAFLPVSVQRTVSFVPLTSFAVAAFDSTGLTQFMDSFGYYVTDDRLMKWTSQTDLWPSGTDNHFSVTTAAGRRLGASGIRLSIPASGLAETEGTITKTIAPGRYATSGFGFRYTAALGWGIAAFADSGSTQCQLVLNTNGTLSVKRGPSGSATTLATTTLRLTANKFYFIEWSVLFDDTDGQIDVWVNNQSLISLSTLDTQTTANDTANEVSIGLIRANGAVAAATWDYTDFYFRTGNRRMDTRTWGDGACVVLHAVSGNGTRTDFTPSLLGGNHGQMVMDQTQDGDTTTNYSESTGATDTYVHVESTNLIQPHGVQGVIVGRVDSLAMTRTVAHVFSIGGTLYIGNDLTPSDTYTHLLTDYTNSPATDTPFTIDELNDAEAGVSITR